jgi:hypothetical protein
MGKKKLDFTPFTNKKENAFNSAASKNGKLNTKANTRGTSNTVNHKQVNIKRGQ